MTPPAASLLEAPPAAPRQLNGGSPTSSPVITAISPTPPEPRRRRGGGLWTAFKWMLAIVCVVGIGVAGAIGWPYLRDAAYDDVNINRADIDALVADQAAAQETIADLQQRLDSLTDDAAAVPAELDDLSTGIEALTAANAAHTERLDGIDEVIAGQTAQIEEIAQAQTDLGAATGVELAALRNELEITRVTELLSRARLYLYQANYGLAITDLTAARDALSDIDPADGGVTAAVRTATLARITLALDALPDQPVPAYDDTNIAWQQLTANATTVQVQTAP